MWKILLFSTLGDKIAPVVSDVLTDIFKSCVHSEQMLSLTPAKPVKVSEIYLSKEQINAQTPGNLLHTFFTSVRPPKKVLEDQLTQVNAGFGAISWGICRPCGITSYVCIRFSGNMVLPSQIRTNTARRERNSTKGKL